MSDRYVVAVRALNYATDPVKKHKAQEDFSRFPGINLGAGSAFGIYTTTEGLADD